MFLVTKVGEVLGKGQGFETFSYLGMPLLNCCFHDLQIPTATLGLQGDGSPFWHIMADDGGHTCIYTCCIPSAYMHACIYT